MAAGSLTIGQLASYAGVTVRAVRHYHERGLLPEPERDESGYRAYDANAVVALIKIRTLADAGVPLARVAELLEADEESFAAAVAEIDRRLRAEIRERQRHRRQIARLTSGDGIALPPVVVDYLDELRRRGSTEEFVRLERDAWILLAARWPREVPGWIDAKVAQLDDPLMARLLAVVNELGTQYDASDPARSRPLVEAAVDACDALLARAEAAGELDEQAMTDRAYTDLVDQFADDAHPAVQEIRELLAERGWSGWTQKEKRGSQPVPGGPVA